MRSALNACLNGPRRGGTGWSGCPFRISPEPSMSGCEFRLSTRNVEPLRWVVRMIARTRSAGFFCTFDFGPLPWLLGGLAACRDREPADEGELVPRKDAE